MGYIELVFTVTSGEAYLQDLLVDALAGIGFDTFEELDSGFKAYITAAAFDPELTGDIIRNFKSDSFVFTVTQSGIEQQNWNEVWESNFEHLLIAGQCYVRATFHAPHPEYPVEIVIDPKMAFGTGHHQTTALMSEYLLEEEDLRGKNILDMGCGTAILAILAAKRGAGKITAIDNDPVCYESALENSKLNGVPAIICVCGSAESIPADQFDLVAANINRNILMDQLSYYAAVMKTDGVLLISGFYEDPDLQLLKNEAIRLGFTFISHKKREEWVAARFKYSP